MKQQSKYPIHQSPFFKLSSHRRLAELLEVDESELAKLLSDDNYRVWTEEGRQIEAPIHKLKRVHSVLKRLLARIQTPEWLISGQRFKSYIDNAKLHSQSDFLLNVDITGFYRHTTVERVYQCFLHAFQMAPDVAFTLSRLVTWNGIIPTGSPASQLLAYWANAPTFHRIADLASQAGLIFSVYVDDLSFSGQERIQPDLPSKINFELGKVGLALKKTKTRFFGMGDFKIVTGVGISRDKRLVVPNEKRQKILQKLEALSSLSESEPLKVETSLRGSLVSARQIEPDFMAVTFRKVQARARMRRRQSSTSNSN